jgi:hypothetical protein
MSPRYLEQMYTIGESRFFISVSLLSVTHAQKQPNFAVEKQKSGSPFRIFLSRLPLHFYMVEKLFSETAAKNVRFWAWVGENERKEDKPQ